MDLSQRVQFCHELLNFFEIQFQYKTPSYKWAYSYFFVHALVLFEGENVFSM